MHVSSSPRRPKEEIRRIWMAILTQSEIKPPVRLKACLDFYGNQLQWRLSSDKRSAPVNVWSKSCTAEVSAQALQGRQRGNLDASHIGLLMQVLFHDGFSQVRFE